MCCSLSSSLCLARPLSRSSSAASVVTSSGMALEAEEVAVAPEGICLHRLYPALHQEEATGLLQ